MNGLSSAQASELLKKYGPNEIRAKKQIFALRIFLSQFTSPLIYVLVFAGLVTLFLRDFADSLVIFAAVFLNTALGFYQEFKAEKSLLALKSLLSPRAKVIRDGKQQIVDARLLVPGDLVALTIGDRVPADGVLVEATDLTLNEAILTGESIPVKKCKMENTKFQKENSVFAGTIVVTGIGKMVVTKTGMETEAGRIGKTVEEAGEEKTPLQIELGKLAKILAVAVGVITLGIFVLGEIRGYPFLQMLVISVAIAVAAIPEGLVVTLTVILALGMERILCRKAIVRQLLAAETLGSVSVICADKTGTLTEGKMRVVEAVTEVSIGFHLRGGSGRTPREEFLIKAAILCNDMRDPLEEAMMKWGEGVLEVESQKLKADYPRIDEIPFSPQTKIIATLHQDKSVLGQTLLFVSGAPEVVLEKSKFQDPKSKIKWLEKIEEYGRRGYRLVGFAYKKIQNPIQKMADKIQDGDLKDLDWLGVLVYEDPPREGVKEALFECQRAGIKVKVITGDYLPTALALLEELKVKSEKLKVNEVITGEELEKISEEELRQRVDEIVLFARTNPQQKLKIVKALKENGEVVAMMGDGVNDAPALKMADIGIVVNEASDVARETADIILLDSNFSTIVCAVEEGRNIFENIKKTTFYLLSLSFTEIILVSGCLLLGLPLPITAAQILWINLIQDSFPALALAFETKEKDLMLKPPSRGMSLFDTEMRVLIFLVGIFNSFLFLLFIAGSFMGFLPFLVSQTLVFVSLGVISSFLIFSCRSLRRLLFWYNPLTNNFLNASVIFGLGSLVLAVYLGAFQRFLGTRPLRIEEWIFPLILGIVNVLTVEMTKWSFLWKENRYNAI